MSQPDIIVDLTNAPGSYQAWVYIERIVIDRNGSVSLSGIPQVEDRWQVNMSLKAVLASNGEAVLDKDGNEIATVVPMNANIGYDIAAIAHYPEVLQCVGLLRDTCIAIASGSIKPA
jgi:hypothetical protein